MEWAISLGLGYAPSISLGREKCYVCFLTVGMEIVLCWMPSCADAISQSGFIDHSWIGCDTSAR